MSVLSRCGTMFVLGLVALLGSSSPSWGKTAVDIEMGELAKDIVAALKKEGAKEVAVGNFNARKRLAASAGLSLEKALSEQLLAMGMKLDEEADYEVEGFYQQYKDPDGILGVKVSATLRDADGEVVLELRPRGIHGDESVPTLLGITGSFTATKDPVERSKQLEKHLDKNKRNVTLKKTTIHADEKSPYAIEILIKKGGVYKAQNPSKDKGRAFVPIGREQVFAIDLINNSEYEAAVTLALDGLSMFAFSENSNYKYMFVRPKSRTRIIGWHLSNEKSAEFVVRALPQGKDAKIKLKDRNSLGTITACFSAAWATNQTPPPGERTRSGKNFVDLGDVKDRKFKEVRRFIGTVRSVVSVRYQKQ